MKSFFRFIFSMGKDLGKAIWHNQYVQAFFQRHPRLMRFAKQRAVTKSFSGLPLTILIILFFYLLQALFEITRGILNSAPIAFVDAHISTLLFAYQSQSGVKFFHFITLIANWQMVTLSCLLLIVFLAWQKRKSLLLGFVLSTGAAAFTSYLGKLIIQRPRPLTGLFNIESYAYPSSHAVLSLMIYGWLAYLFFRYLSKSVWKKLLLMACLLIILLVGFSRLYLGYHFLSDVAGGYLIAGLWLIIGIGLAEWQQEKNREKTIKFSRKQKTALFFGVVTQVIVLIMFSFIYQPPSVQTTQQQIMLGQQPPQSIFSPPYSLSKYSETPTSQTQEPISFIIIAKDEKSLKNLFQTAGWQIAVDPSFPILWKMASAAAQNHAFAQAPLTPVFWNNQVHNIGIEKSTQTNSVRQRHHARFWNTQVSTSNNYQIFIGTVSFDSNVKWLITHEIDPDIDTEREYLFNDLQQTKQIDTYEKIQLVERQLGKNFSGDAFFTDGQAYVIYLP